MPSVSSLLPDDKARIKRSIPAGNKILTATVARIFYQQGHEWDYSGIQGGLCLVVDKMRGGVWWKVVDLLVSTRLGCFFIVKRLREYGWMRVDPGGMTSSRPGSSEGAQAGRGLAAASRASKAVRAASIVPCARSCALMLAIASTGPLEGSAPLIGSPLSDPVLRPVASAGHTRNHLGARAADLVDVVVQPGPRLLPQLPVRGQSRNELP